MFAKPGVHGESEEMINRGSITRGGRMSVVGIA